MQFFINVFYLFLFGLLFQLAHGRIIGKMQDVKQSIDVSVMPEPEQHTDDEIIAATRFMTLAPYTINSDKITQLMVEMK